MPDQWTRKRETMKHYDQAADVYDAQYKEEQNAKIAATLTALEKTDMFLVLDAGCGTGLLFDHIADKAKQIVGTDMSKNLLKHAKNNVKVHDNVHLVQADADHAPFPNKTFTAAFAFTLLQNMPNPETTLNEIKRITQKNAIITVTGLKKQFSLEAFTQLLKNARLEIFALKADEKLKDFVAICRKR